MERMGWKKNEFFKTEYHRALFITSIKVYSAFYVDIPCIAFL